MMIKNIVFSALLLLSFASWGKLKKSNYMPGEILVKYKTSFTKTSISSHISKMGDRRLNFIGRQGIAHIKVSKNRSIEQAIEDYKNNPDVEYAQPNYIYKIDSTTPNDARFSQMWGLKNTAQTIVNAGGPDSPSSTSNPGISGKDMGMQYAWDINTDCSSVVVAVIDSGVNYNHEDLSSNMWNGGASYPLHGYNFVDGNNDPMDLNGHGTHVAATIGAVGNNSVGVTGVCWTAKIMAIRVMDTTGSGNTASITQGVDFAVANGAKVINMSIGGTSYDAAFNSAISSAQSNGVVVVVAAGNSTINNDSTPHYPCNYTQSNLICVAALNQSYGLASFSNYGATSVDVGAPGVNIVSSWPGTHSKTADNFTSSWNYSSTSTSSWAYANLNIGGSATPSLVIPSNFNYSSNKYANSSNEYVWKEFNLSGVSAATVNYYAGFALEENTDYIILSAKSGGGNPSAGGTGIIGYTGTTNGSLMSEEYDLTPHKSANTSVGFNLISNATVNDYGMAILNFYIKKLILNTTSYNVISGTSMASPHVAGLAALIWGHNPSYTYSDVVNAIKAGGVDTSSLSGKTSTGKAVSAIGSLIYINAPTGVGATIIP